MFCNLSRTENLSTPPELCKTKYHKFILRGVRLTETQLSHSLNLKSIIVLGKAVTCITDKTRQAWAGNTEPSEAPNSSHRPSVSYTPPCLSPSRLRLKYRWAPACKEDKASFPGISSVSSSQPVVKSQPDSESHVRRSPQVTARSLPKEQLP